MLLHYFKTIFKGYFVLDALFSPRFEKSQQKFYRGISLIEIWYLAIPRKLAWYDNTKKAFALMTFNGFFVSLCPAVVERKDLSGQFVFVLQEKEG